MFRTRLWVGTLLALLMGGVLVGDAYLAPVYPFLLVFMLGLGVLAAGEFLAMTPPADRPPRWFLTLGVLALLAANWVPAANPAELLLGAFAAATMIAFVREMAAFTEAGGHTGRAARGVLAFAYMGVLPGFLVRIRTTHPETGSWLLALAIFVPKVGDIGAYVAGHAFGRHTFAPRLSPKKTWEGFVGGTAAAMGLAVGVQCIVPVFPFGLPEAAAFGLAVGFTGVVGDLAESLIKRDSGSKDASRTIPGFGGVLDVVDSVLFAAPVAFYWFLSR